MEPLEIYDYLTLTRQRIFDCVRPLGDEQYAQEFPIGLRTLGRTLTHIMISEWYYVQRMLERDVPPYEAWPIQQEDPPRFAVLEPAWGEQATQTRTALNAIGDWRTDLEYGVTTDDGVRQIVTASAGDLFTQLALHEVHHRAQVMNMLRHLGAAVEDLDFNAFFVRRDAGPDAP